MALTGCVHPPGCPQHSMRSALWGGKEWQNADHPPPRGSPSRTARRRPASLAHASPSRGVCPRRARGRHPSRGFLLGDPPPPAVCASGSHPRASYWLSQPSMATRMAPWYDLFICVCRAARCVRCRPRTTVLCSASSQWLQGAAPPSRAVGAAERRV